MSLYRGNQILECGGVPSNTLLSESPSTATMTKKSIKDADGTYIAPKTTTDAVINDDGTSLKDSIANRHKLLWSNPNENSGSNLPSFNAQTIAVDTSGYDAIEITYALYNRTNVITQKFIILSNFSQYSMNWSKSDTVSGYQNNVGSRYFSISNNAITFDDCYYTYNTTASKQNLYMIPIRIYGIKY